MEVGGEDESRVEVGLGEEIVRATSAAVSSRRLELAAGGSGWRPTKDNRQLEGWEVADCGGWSTCKKEAQERRKRSFCSLRRT